MLVLFCCAGSSYPSPPRAGPSLAGPFAYSGILKVERVVAILCDGFNRLISGLLLVVRLLSVVRLLLLVLFLLGLLVLLTVLVLGLWLLFPFYLLLGLLTLLALGLFPS